MAKFFVQCRSVAEVDAGEGCSPIVAFGEKDIKGRAYSKTVRIDRITDKDISLGVYLEAWIRDDIIRTGRGDDGDGIRRPSGAAIAALAIKQGPINGKEAHAGIGAILEYRMKATLRVHHQAPLKLKVRGRNRREDLHRLPETRAAIFARQDLNSAG